MKKYLTRKAFESYSIPRLQALHTKPPYTFHIMPVTSATFHKLLP